MFVEIVASEDHCDVGMRMKCITLWEWGPHGVMCHVVVGIGPMVFVIEQCDA